MLTKFGIFWVIIEILLACQMFYYIIMNTGKTYMIVTLAYWLWLAIYAWNPFNIFYHKERQNDCL